jgi:hypothetical protein
LVKGLRQLAGEPHNLLAELEVTATRQARLGSPVGVRRGGPKPVFFHESGSALLADVCRGLLAWGETAALAWTHFERQTRTPSETATWLADHPGLLAGLEGVEVLHQQIGSQVRRIVRMIDRPGEYAYLGQCSSVTDAGECERFLYAPKAEGLLPSVHQCPGCGTDHDVADRRRHMVAAKIGLHGTAVDISRVYGAFEIDVSPARIRKWKQLGKLRPINPGGYPPLYDLAAVEALLFPDSVPRVGEAS